MRSEFDARCVALPGNLGFCAPSDVTEVRRVTLRAEALRFWTAYARLVNAGACNAVLIKVNQAGTVTKSMLCMAMAQAARYRAIVSARSGETDDPSISHLSVGLNAGQLKVGSITRSERMAKWNECLRIAEALPPGAFVGGAPLANTWWGRSRRVPSADRTC